MLTHVMVGANDLAQAKSFYDATLSECGISPGMDADARVFYSNGGVAFGICRPLDGGAASPGNGGTIGFTAESTAAVDAFYATGLVQGGSCAGAPGISETPIGPVYSAYVRDLDGNKICALYRLP